MASKILLKDLLFNERKVEKVAHEIQHVFPSFKPDNFVKVVVTGFRERELKSRITWMAECLKMHLPGEYSSAIAVLLKSLPPPNNPTLSDNDFGDFIYASYSEFVARNGCTKQHLNISLDALYEMTQRFSAEDAIRYFINAFPRETMKALVSWTNADHYHIRRLCSEGTRPKLPWARKISIPTDSSLPILDKLFSDHTRYVTRSVANHLNDLSKIKAKLVLDKLSEWRKSGKQVTAEMDYITHHSLRTLIKQGHPEAMKILGFNPVANVHVSRFSASKVTKMNSAMTFSFLISSKSKTRVVLDYVLHFQNKSGELGSKKVFKLKTLTLQKKKPILVEKRHMLREVMTTRKLYPGIHRIEIQVNGKILARASFLLKK